MTVMCLWEPAKSVGRMEFQKTSTAQQFKIAVLGMSYNLGGVETPLSVERASGQEEHREHRDKKREPREKIGFYGKSKTKRGSRTLRFESVRNFVFGLDPFRGLFSPSGVVYGTGMRLKKKQPCSHTKHLTGPKICAFLCLFRLSSSTSKNISFLCGPLSPLCPLCSSCTEPSQSGVCPWKEIE